MHFTTNIIFTFIICLLISCSGNDSNTQGNPENAKATPTPLPKATGFLKIGFIERNFSDQKSAVCILDTTHNEAVITFHDPESGATISMRLLNRGTKDTSHTLLSGGARGVAFLSLGGDRNTNAFQLRSNTSACLINYKIADKQMQATFQCQNISNSYGLHVNADGSWLCNTQTSNEWSW